LQRDAIDNPWPSAESVAMSKLEIIETEVRNLPREEAFKLQDWLAEYLEDQAELNPEFVASIERGKADLREGRVRVREG
jgi:hypothetical protein